MKRSALLLAAVLTSPAAGAATIHYQMTGTVTEVLGAAQSEFALGEPVTLAVSVDDTGRNTPVPWVEYYDAFDLTLTIGDYSVTGTGGDAQMLNDFADAIDLFGVDFITTELTGPPVAGFPPEYFSIRLAFLTSVFDSVALPLVVPLDQAESNSASLRYAVDDGLKVYFRIDSIQVVPEPSTGLLALCGLLGLGWLGRRTR
jgi:hypothetical protein